MPSSYSRSSNSNIQRIEQITGFNIIIKINRPKEITETYFIHFSGRLAWTASGHADNPSSASTTWFDGGVGGAYG